MNFRGYINLAKTIPSLVILSRYNEDYSWINEYTSNYMIFNKGERGLYDLHDIRIRNVPNLGGNQRDIFQFFYESYQFLSLFKTIAFIQANPFDHCNKETFDKIIYNEYFTPIEDYGPIPSNGYENRTSDGGFIEINNSWYIQAHNSTYGLTCRYKSFDDFMNHYFINYDHVDWIRFAPGSQYIIEYKQALRYPREFWFSLMNELNTLRPTEGHIIERALYMILDGKLEVRREIL
jgi:hypothetical protein